MKNHSNDPTAGHPFQLPIVYAKEATVWEYKQLVRNLAKEDTLDENELNSLGADGWELTAIFADSPFVYFYLKRMKS
jgi:hypothetical protein